MIENQDIRPAQVIGPLGEPLTVDDLPSPDTKRWVVRRKAEVVAAVNGGLLTIDEVLERYSLSLEEFASWQRAVDRSGTHLHASDLRRDRDQVIDLQPHPLQVGGMHEDDITSILSAVEVLLFVDDGVELPLAANRHQSKLILFEHSYVGQFNVMDAGST